MEELSTSGESVKAVAKRLGIGPSTAYDWQRGRGSRPKRAKSPTFARVVPKSKPGLVLEIGAGRIRLEPGLDPELLRSVLAALEGTSQ